MLLIKLLRFLLGYVRFSAHGGFSERFINLCSRSEINMWDLKSRDCAITACADFSSYRRIRAPARKAGMRVQILEKRGLPFILRRHRSRLGLAAGAVIFAVCIAVLSTRIWSIDVAGNNETSSQEILEVMSEFGIKRGMKKSAFSSSEIQTAALEKLPGLSWLYVNINGSKAIIEVRELIETPLGADDGLYDLVSAASGQLVTLRVFNGTPMLPVGSAVLSGDVLISGIEENRDGTADVCGAQGYAEALTRREVSSEAAECETLTVQKKQAQRYALSFLTLEIPLGRLAPDEGQTRFEDTSYLLVNGVELPFGLIKYSYYSAEEVEHKAPREERVLTAKARFFERIATDFRYLRVNSQRISLLDSEGTATVAGTFDCLESIGFKRPLQIEELPQEQASTQITQQND